MSSKPRFREQIRNRPVLFDGAMGTMLFAAGLENGESPEPWNWERPAVVQGIYRAYYEAGADVVQTNTFGGTPIRMAERDLQKRVHKANLQAAKALREVCPAGRHVAGDIGPTGKFMQPRGEFTPAEFEAAFEAQIDGLLEGGIDLVSIETMYSLQEALCCLRAVRRATDLPVVASMTFDHNPRGFFTLMGETVSHCLKALADHGADVVGSNCSHGTETFIELARLIRDSTDLPVIVQPNRGQPVLAGGGVVYRQTAGAFAGDMDSIVALGVNVVGGCCGTDPECIDLTRRALDRAPRGDATSPESWSPGAGASRALPPSLPRRRPPVERR